MLLLHCLPEVLLHPASLIQGFRVFDPRLVSVKGAGPADSTDQQPEGAPVKSKLMLCALLACSLMHAQPRLLGKVLRRATLAASCAASLWDYQTTVAGARYGAVEQNGLLAGSNGRPRLGLMLGMKVGFCGAAIAMQELRPNKRGRLSNVVATVGNAASATRYLLISLSNISVCHNLQRAAPGPSTPYYLMSPAAAHSDERRSIDGAAAPRNRPTALMEVN